MSLHSNVAGKAVAVRGTAQRRSPAEMATGRPALICVALSCLLAPSLAWAHVKWFEAYEVSAEPVPITTTLALPYFWVGILLVAYLLARP